MTFDVVGFGAINLDKLFKVDLIAQKEEEGFVTGYKEAAGGSASNTVVGLARLQQKTGFVGRVGSDSEGKLLLKEFSKEGVDISGITVQKGGRSGTVMGFVDPNGDRALYVDPASNDQTELKDIDRGYVSGSKFLHLSSFVGEKPFQAQKQLVKQLTDTKISFDPGALYARKGLDSLKPLIKRSYVLFPNELETKLLTGKDYKQGAQIFSYLGVKVVVVKLGSRGCYVFDGKEGFTVEAFKVDAVDTTGAGDAFCAGFLYGLLKQKDLHECGRLGNFVASRCVEKMGARTGLPTLEELEAFF